MPVYTTTKEACQKHPDAITHGAPGLEGPQGGPQGPRAGPRAPGRALEWIFGFSGMQWICRYSDALRCSTTICFHVMANCKGQIVWSEIM